MILPNWPMEKIKKSLTENYYYFLSEFFHTSPHIQVIRDPQISMLVSDIPDSRFNCVFKTNLTDTDLTHKIQEIKQIYAKHEVPFAWLVSEDDKPHNHHKHPVVSGLLVNYAAVAGIYNCFGAYDEALREAYEQDMMRFILNRAIELKLPYAVTITHLPNYPLYQAFDFQGCSYFKKFIFKNGKFKKRRK